MQEESSLDFSESQTSRQSSPLSPSAERHAERLRDAKGAGLSGGGFGVFGSSLKGMDADAKENVGADTRGFGGKEAASSPSLAHDSSGTSDNLEIHLGSAEFSSNILPENQTNDAIEVTEQPAQNVESQGVEEHSLNPDTPHRKKREILIPKKIGTVAPEPYGDKLTQTGQQMKAMAIAQGRQFGTEQRPLTKKGVVSEWDTITEARGSEAFELDEFGLAAQMQKSAGIPRGFNYTLVEYIADRDEVLGSLVMNNSRMPMWRHSWKYVEQCISRLDIQQPYGSNPVDDYNLAVCKRDLSGLPIDILKQVIRLKKRSLVSRARKLNAPKTPRSPDKAYRPPWKDVDQTQTGGVEEAKVEVPEESQDPPSQHNANQENHNHQQKGIPTSRASRPHPVHITLPVPVIQEESWTASEISSGAPTGSLDSVPQAHSPSVSQHQTATPLSVHPQRSSGNGQEFENQNRPGVITGRTETTRGSGGRGRQYTTMKSKVEMAARLKQVPRPPDQEKPEGYEPERLKDLLTPRGLVPWEDMDSGDWTPPGAFGEVEFYAWNHIETDSQDSRNASAPMGLKVFDNPFGKLRDMPAKPKTAVKPPLPHPKPPAPVSMPAITPRRTSHLTESDKSEKSFTSCKQSNLGELPPVRRTESIKCERTQGSGSSQPKTPLRIDIGQPTGEELIGSTPKTKQPQPWTTPRGRVMSIRAQYMEDRFNTSTLTDPKADESLASIPAGNQSPHFSSKTPVHRVSSDLDVSGVSVSSRQGRHNSIRSFLKSSESGLSAQYAMEMHNPCTPSQLPTSAASERIARHFYSETAQLDEGQDPGPTTAVDPVALQAYLSKGIKGKNMAEGVQKKKRRSRVSFSGELGGIAGIAVANATSKIEEAMVKLKHARHEAEHPEAPRSSAGKETGSSSDVLEIPTPRLQTQGSRASSQISATTGSHRSHPRTPNTANLGNEARSAVTSAGGSPPPNSLDSGTPDRFNVRPLQANELVLDLPDIPGGPSGSSHTSHRGSILAAVSEEPSKRSLGSEILSPTTSLDSPLQVSTMSLSPRMMSPRTAIRSPRDGTVRPVSELHTSDISGPNLSQSSIGSPRQAPMSPGSFRVQDRNRSEALQEASRPAGKSDEETNNPHAVPPYDTSQGRKGEQEHVFSKVKLASPSSKTQSKIKSPSGDTADLMILGDVSGWTASD